MFANGVGQLSSAQGWERTAGFLDGRSCLRVNRLPAKVVELRFSMRGSMGLSTYNGAVVVCQVSR